MDILDYDERISECLKQAELAPNPEARRLWKHMEQFWRDRASGPQAPRRTFAELQTIGSPPTAAKR